MDETAMMEKNKDEIAVSGTPPLPVVPKPENLDSENTVLQADFPAAAPEQKDSSSESSLATPAQPTTRGIESESDTDIAKEDDIFGNGEYSFRVDRVTAEGTVRIRFRSDVNLDAKPFSPQKILAFLKNEKSAPEGDWLFGSKEEFQRFADENGYHLEKRRRVIK